MRTTIIATLCFLFVANGIHAQIIDKAIFKGRVFLKGSGSVPYLLIITYAPTHPDDPDSRRRVAAITLTLNGKKVLFPRAAFADLSEVHRPWPLFGDGIDPRRARLHIEGGDASKAYSVDYVVTKDRLVLREITRHAATIPEVTSYYARAKK